MFSTVLVISTSMDCLAAARCSRSYIHRNPHNPSTCICMVLRLGQPCLGNHPDPDASTCFCAFWNCTIFCSLSGLLPRPVVLLPFHFLRLHYWCPGHPKAWQGDGT